MMLVKTSAGSWPPSASAMARRIPDIGRVEVSPIRSMRVVVVLAGVRRLTPDFAKFVDTFDNRNVHGAADAQCVAVLHPV